MKSVKDYLSKQKSKIAGIPPKKRFYLGAGIFLGLVLVFTISTKVIGAIIENSRSKLSQESSVKKTLLKPLSPVEPSPKSSSQSSAKSDTDASESTPSTTTSQSTSQSDDSANQSSQDAQSSPDSQDSSGTSDSNNSNSSSNDSEDNSLNLTACDSSAYYTYSPLDSADFNGLVPLGNLNPSGHVFPTDHIYFYLAQPLSQVPLYAPGNATVTSISGSEHIDEGFTDYSIYFQPCSELKTYFLHVSSLSQKLSDAFTAPYQWDNEYTTGDSRYRNYGKNLNITIDGGEQIGTVGGNTDQGALDMGAYDTRTTLTFANASRWSNSDTLHTVCPIDNYSSDMKTTLYNRFGDYDGGSKRTIEPICGTIEQDQANTAQGVWFAKNQSNNPEDPHLALVHNNIDPTKAVFSVGTSMSASSLSTGTYSFSPLGSGLVNRDFGDITSDNNVYCFEPDSLSSIIILQLTSSTALKIEKQSPTSCGSGPWNFTVNATEFDR